MRRVFLMFGCLAGMYSSYALANNAATYCNDMYPSGSYDPAERAEYVSECLDSYSGYEAVEETEAQSQASDSQASEAPAYESQVSEGQVSAESYSESQPAQAEQDYYEGTVEDYVNSDSEAVNYE